MSRQALGHVYLVGAGPGDPGLLTLRAVECLQQADVVIYDRLVSPALLDFAPAHAERHGLAELPGCRHWEKWPHINALLVETARAGKTVVRLKSGDPCVFGRGGEEAQVLQEAGIPFEIVPGVTAALGASAYAGIPLTHRGYSSGVALVTGHEDPTKPESTVDWSVLAPFPGTLVLYMGMARLPGIVEALLRHGKSPMTPAAVIEQGTTGRQRTIEAPLAELPQAVQQAGIKPPAAVVIGEVVGLRRQLTWFEKRPLVGKQILITRPAGQARDFARRLEQLGATTFSVPTVEIQEPADWGAADAALQRLAEFDWLVFTSSNGAHAFIRRLRQLGRDLRALGTVKLAAIGPSTAEVLRQYYLEPDLVPDAYRSEALADALMPHVQGKRVLLARADRGREILREQLTSVAQVEQITVYRQLDAALDRTSPGLAALAKGEIDYVTLTSANIARSLLRGLEEPSRRAIHEGQTQLVSISPVTSEAIRELGYRVGVEAEVYTTHGMVQAILSSQNRLARSASEGTT